MAENKNDSIIFEAEDGTEVEFAVLEQTTLGGINYLFVVDKAVMNHSLYSVRTADLIRKRWQHTILLKMKKIRCSYQDI